MKPLLAFCLVALLGCVDAAAQPLRTWERLDLPLEEGLRLALNQQIDHRDAFDYILWAGYRGNSPPTAPSSGKSWRGTRRGGCSSPTPASP